QCCVFHAARQDLVRSQPQFPAAAAARDRAPRRRMAVEPGDPDRAGATHLAGARRARRDPDPARAQKEAADRLWARLSGTRVLPHRKLRSPLRDQRSARIDAAGSRLRPILDDVPSEAPQEETVMLGFKKKPEMPS